MTDKRPFGFIEEPITCPCCLYPLEKVNDQLFCRNTACEAQITKKIEHFSKVLGIKGMGPKTIEKLKLQEITELYYLDYSETVDAVGEKIADKLFSEIEKSKNASLASVIEAFSIPLVGGTAAAKLASCISSLDDINIDSCKKAGLGEKVTKNILNWIETEYKELKEFLPFTYKQTKNVSGKTVCITGKLKSYKNRSEAEAELSKAGYTVVQSVTKSTNYLVDESDNISSKKEKAIKYGVIIITDLNDLLKEEANKYDSRI